MAATGISALADSIFAELVESFIVKEQRPANTSREFVRFARKGPSNVASFPRYTSTDVAAAPADDITDISSTAMADAQVSATAAEVGFRVDVSDVVREVAVQNVVSDASAYVMRAVAEKWETDLAALMDDFSNITTAASTLTGLDLLAAVSALEQRNIPGPYVAYLDPKQSGELRADIATTTASYHVGRDGELVRPFGDSGYAFEYMGVPIWQTTLVVTTTGLVGGAVFRAGEAIGAYEIWGPRLETQRDASLRSLELVGTQCYGLVEIRDVSGQTLKSAA